MQTLLSKSIGKAWTEAAGSTIALGIHLFLKGHGLVVQNITPIPPKDNPLAFFDHLLEPDTVAIWDAWVSRQLSKESAKRLQVELAEIFRRYPAEDGEGTKTYMIRLALAPLIDSE